MYYKITVYKNGAYNVFMDGEKYNAEKIDNVATYLLNTLQRGTKIVIDRKKSLHDDYMHYMTYEIPLYSEMQRNRLKQRIHI